MKDIVITSITFCLLFLSSFKPNDISIMKYTFQDTVKRDTLEIDTVGINKGLTPDQKYEARKKQYRTAYMWGDNKNPVIINPLGGIAININKLYSHFSKKGKNSRRLMKLFKNEYDIDRTEVLCKPLTVKLTDLRDSILFSNVFYSRTRFFSECYLLRESRICSKKYAYLS